MFRRLRAQALLIPALLLTFSGSVEAQAYGRVTVMVKSEKGDPLKGVKVVVTCDELTRFHEESTTNKKGRAIFSFTDATKVYNFHFEYEDFQPADLPIKPEIRGSITREVILSEGQVVTAQEGGQEVRTIYSPAERVFNEGVAALQAGDMATAKTKFLAALDKNGKMVLAHSALAGVYIEEGDFESALASVNVFMEAEPNNPRALRMLYEAQKGLGNEDEAKKVLDKLAKLDRDGDAAAMIYNEGVAAIKVGDLASAKKSFEAALAVQPDLEAAIGAMAIIYLQDKNYQGAAEMAERHLQLSPDSARSLRVRWDAYRGLGDTEKAKMALDALAAEDPTVLIAELYNKGNELFDNGDTSGAIENFEQILSIDPNYPRAHYRLGVSLISAGQTDAAKEHLQKFLELAPEDPEAAAARDMLGYLN